MTKALKEFRTIAALYRSLKIEAERLYAMCFTNKPGFADLEDEFNIVETELKRLETIEQPLIKRGFDNLEDFIKQLDKYVQMSEKEHEKLMTLESQTSQNKLDAFDIIKKKRVNVGSFIKWCANFSYEEYKKQWSNWHKYSLYNLSEKLLTEEEFNTLKRLLL